MIINGFCANGFRNLKNINIKPDSGINVIFGENAQGKTNILEGIYLFSGMKSFRGVKDSETVNFDGERAKLELSFFSHSRQQTSGINIEKKRTAVLNGVELESPSVLSSQSHIIVFSPQHTEIVRGAPKSRRSFLNSGIGSVYPIYAEHIRKYTRVLFQRNTLLKQIKYNSTLMPLLDDYDRALAEYGVRIVHARERYIKRLLKYLPKIYSDLSGKRENIEIKYISALSADTPDEAAELFKLKRAEDLNAGTTAFGPHRDDLDFLINGVSAKEYGSQGQQKSVVLALKLAEAQLLREVCGEQPVALLDDVMSELDYIRQDYILNHIKDWQVFVTCCEQSAAEKLKAGAAFRVENGSVQRVL